MLVNHSNKFKSYLYALMGKNKEQTTSTVFCIVTHIPTRGRRTLDPKVHHTVFNGYQHATS